MKHLFALLALVFILASGCSSSNRLSREPFFGFALDGYPITVQKLEKIRTETGTYGKLILFYIQWPGQEDKTNPFPIETLNNIRNVGAVACITWEPMRIKDGKEIIIPAEDIISGKYDDYISGFARAASRWRAPLLIRFAHEMNLKRYHWGVKAEEYGPESPAIYIEMYQHIVDTARAAGGENILWVFCPNAESVPSVDYDESAEWNIMENYYPGDNYVDLLGLDGYNWGISRTAEEHGWKSRHQTFRNIFEAPYRQLRKIAPEKPIMIFEMGSVGTASEKTEWLKDAFKTAEALEIAGIIWFQVDKENDWEIKEDINEIMDAERQAEILSWLEKIKK